MFKCFCLLISVAIPFSINADKPVQEFLYLKQLNLPQNLKPLKVKKPLVIAVVDDGVRITHKDIKAYIWKNALENPDNGMDDDGNGYVNDINGWDVADNNGDITPPLNTRFDFYHGTHLAGIITKVVKSVYGEEAPKYIQIMPVKTIKDTAETPYIKAGYKGIEYAINAGADIILTAWSVGHISEQESKIIQQGHDKGILIVAAAGNFSNNEKQYPAAENSVLSVAALGADSKKIKQSNFGDYVDISAPGYEINSASFSSDSDYETHTGTSPASAIMAAVAAVVKLQNPNYSWEKVKACIKNSADPLADLNERYIGQLGAGAVNFSAAVSCNTDEEQFLTLPQSYISLNKRLNPVSIWHIKPKGEFKGIRFRKTALSGELSEAIISIYKESAKDAQPFLRYNLAELPDTFYVPGTTAKIHLEIKNTSLEFDWLLEYKVESIDFSKLYCKGTQYLKKEGMIEDGSGDKDYSYHTSCKWLITAPKGKVIRFNFTELDTEENVDKIHFFNGEGTHEKMMGFLSGKQYPPELITWSNKVLVWFVTDGKNQGKGWKANYYFQDPK